MYVMNRKHAHEARLPILVTQQGYCTIVANIDDSITHNYPTEAFRNIYLHHVVMNIIIIFYLN